MVGRSTTSQPMRWSDAHGAEILGDLPGGNAFGSATKTSADGHVVVGFSRQNFSFLGHRERAFIWDDTHRMRSIQLVLELAGIDLADWTLTTATSVPADGRTIVGSARNTQGVMMGWIAVIPEPSTALQLGLGLTLLATKRARNRSGTGSEVVHFRGPFYA